MNALINLAETWWPLYAVHMVEISLFIVLVWAVDRWLTLETRFRYTLYLLALAKVFVPPVLAVPIPAFLVSPAGGAVVEPIYSGVVSEAVAVSPKPVTTLPPAFYLFCVWILSVSVWTGVALWKNSAFRRTLKSATPIDLAGEVASLEAPHNLEVYSKSALPSPILVGLLKPRLFLPTRWSSWSSEELRGVVRHELAHFERRDMHVLILQAIATALFGANPLIWLLNRRLIYLRELRCDEAVLRETRLTPAEYGRLLLGLVDRRPAPRALTVFFSDRGATLRKRLEHVLNYKEVDMKRSKLQLAALVLVCLAIVPLSIREAYTLDERRPGALNPTEGLRESELKPVQQTVPPVTFNPETATVGVPTDDEAEVETKPVTLSQLPSSIVIRDVFGKFLKSYSAREAGFDVTVTLKVQAGVDGSVRDVRFISADGPVGFKNAVKDAISRMRLKPAKHDSENAPVWFTQEMRYKYPSTNSLDTVDSAAPVDTGRANATKIDLVNTKPEPKRIVTPEYPRRAHKEKIEGGDDANVLEFWSADVKPVLMHSVAPVYPDEAKKAGLSGNVFLKFRVNVDGSVSAIRVLKGQPEFRKPAMDAISQFRFKPAEREGKPVAVWMSHVIRFGRPKPKAMPPPGSSDPDGDKVFDISSVDVKPNVIHSVQPVYPEWARFTGGEKGIVNLKFKVNVDGSVNDVRVLNGRSVFVKSAVDAISQFRFQPGEREGKPVPVWMTHRISFSPPKPMATSSPGAGDVASESVFEFRSVDSKPVVIHSVQPVYPDVAKEAGLAGDVALKFEVNVDGTVSDVDAFVLKGGKIFRKPAIDAVKQFLYKPAEHDGEAVAVRMTHHFAFAPSEHQDEAASKSSDVGGDTVYEFWDVDVKPVNVNLRTVQPVYPDHARETGLTGNVFVKFKINVDGSVSDAEVLRGDEVFRQPAIDAVNQFRFKPAEIGGKPVPVWMSQRIVFALPED